MRVLAALAFLAPGALTQAIITTAVGTDTVFQDNGRPATQARIGQSEGILLAGDGTLYFSDYDLHQIFKVGTDGFLRVFAGNGIRGFSGDGGPATGASLNLPLRLAIDAAGNVYFADSNNSRIRRITPDGIVSTFAGTGAAGFAGDNGPAAKAVFLNPRGVSTDSAGNMYIADTGNHRIRKVTPDGTIRTIAGTGTSGFSGDGGQASLAALSFPRQAVADAAGNVYIADTANGRLRKISAADGTISTLTASLGSVISVQLGPNGSVYATGTNRVYLIPATGPQQIVAGIGTAEFSGDGGKATAAGLDAPTDIAAGPAGSFYFSDSGNFRIRLVDSGGIISTFAGSGQYRVSPDGAPGNTVQLSSPWGLNVDTAGNLFIAEYNLHRVRKVTPDGRVFNFAGTGRPGPAVSGIPATQAALNFPTWAVAGPDGSVYIADALNLQIRRVDGNGIITKFAGGGTSQADGIPATLTQLGQLHGLFVDSAGAVYYSDPTYHRVRKITKDGLVTTLAGTGVAGYNGDGVAKAAQVNTPKGIFVDKLGNVYFCDYGNSRVRKITTDGQITTIAGNGSTAAPTFGMLSTVTSLPFPWAITLAASGNILVSGGLQVYQIANGVTTLAAGSGASTPFAGDGGLATRANLGFPQGVALDAAGNLYIADANYDRVRVVLAAPPSFQASPATLAFTAPAGGAPTAAQSVSLSSVPPGLTFSIAGTLPPWLSVTPATGTLPATLQLIADPSKQVQGTLNYALNIVVANAVPSTRTVNVTFNVNSALLPSLSVVDTSLSFAFGAGSPPDVRNITVRNPGSGSLNFTATTSTTSGGNWLSVVNPSGVLNAGVPVLVGVRATPGTLSPGVYLGSVRITASNGQSNTVAVSMTINAQRQSIQLSQSGLTFIGVANGGFILPQSFAVLNTGQGVMNWTAKASTLSGGSWLSLSQAAGASDAASSTVPFVQVSVNAAGLGAGTYYGRIAVSASAADNSPQVISVVLSVLPAGTTPGPAVQPTSLIFTGAAGAAEPPSSQNFLIGNPGNSSLSYVSGALTFDGESWLQALPPTGAVPTDQAATVVVQTDNTGLTAGVRRGVLTLLFSDGSTRLVNVLLVLTAGGGGSISERGAAGCTPAKLLPLISSIGQDFNVPAAWPTALVVKVVDDCGNPMVTGSVTASFSNGDPPLSLVSLKDGSWSGTWQPRNATITQTSISLNAQVPEQNIQGAITVSGSLRPNADPPQVNSGGVVSAASFGQSGVLAPGSFVSIFGARFADGLNVAPGYPWGTELVGTEVILGGRSLPLYFTAGGQINAVVPIDTPVNTRQQLIVRRGTTYTVPEPVTIAAAQPAIFTSNLTGRGQGDVFVHSASGVETIADAAHPARAGDVLVSYCAGLGLTNPAVGDGQPASTTILSPTLNTVTMTVGGVNANVFFAGLAPGFIGLYQVNATMPAGVAPGDSVPVVLTVGGQSSPAVTIGVR